MLLENEFSIYDFIYAISETLDLASPTLSHHHHKVGYIAYLLGRQMQLPASEVHDIVIAALLHDIGAFSLNDRLDMINITSIDTDVNQHSIIGYKLLSGIDLLYKPAEMILYHHADYSKNKDRVPLGSYVLHLADRIAVLLDEKKEIFIQLTLVRDKLHDKSPSYHPEVLKAFDELTDLVHVWIDLFSPSIGYTVIQNIATSQKVNGLDAMIEFVKVLAQIIDFRSRFTATHSSGVAAVAKEITTISGFSAREVKLMEIAGYLHDIGKLAVPNSILEKPAKLDVEEMNIVKKHTYYTYSILKKINGMDVVATWAAYHHERLDGKGYPFHIKGDDFSKLARIMAVADIMTALTEDRPYRAGMDKDEALQILLSMVKDQAIDESIVRLVQENYGRINEVRIKAQTEALSEYEAFFDISTLERFGFAA
ncbi:MAG: HD domain-containing protein [Coriobacteriia bacterium]|nr:HD domain-containing protein [Coriobacteriia bacterium]